MATKKSIKKTTVTKDDFLGGELSQKEEKTLDMILNGVIVFVLAWLGLGILLSVGGLFNLWK